MNLSLSLYIYIYVNVYTHIHAIIALPPQAAHSKIGRSRPAPADACRLFPSQNATTT